MNHSGNSEEHIMGTSSFSRLAIFTVLMSALQTSVFAQGSLTPPGAPAPTMKSLDQMEARTAITNISSLVTISQPGSYYLTHNLTVTTGDAIDITASQVTLDLNGFTISSTAASATGTAIYLARLDGNTDITILNGHIKSGVTNTSAGVFGGSGFVNGIYLNNSASSSNIRIDGISVYGCLGYGIGLGYNNSTVVDSCNVKVAGVAGIYADVVTRSAALTCGSGGILGVSVSDSRGEELKTSGYGIQATSVHNSIGFCNGANAIGIDASEANGCSANSYGANSTALHATCANNCTGNDSSPSGGTAISATTAINCCGGSFSGTGITANIANSCVITIGAANITHKYNMP
jgi:hypothetical protein